MVEEKLLFEDLKLSRQFLNAVKDQGYTSPTAIQQKVIPLALAGHDLLGVAQTGTGKTAAFVLPLLMKLKYAQGEHARELILAPTRELVMQIKTHLDGLAAYTDLRSVALYGGVGPKVQMEALAAGTDLIVSTPRRFLDLYKKGAILPKFIKTMVLDEADKMMDMGFMPQIRSLLEIMPHKRQNMLFSATMPDKVVKLTEEFLEFPERVEVVPPATTAETIRQSLYEVPNFKTKINLLEHLFQNAALSRVILFVKTKTNADNLARFLNRKSLGPVRVIHANKGQNSRINAMEDFKSGEIRVLVSTDVTARGMDISMVSHVINFDVPLVYEDYVHRIGRTGRAENKGTAITFANEVEMIHISRIEALIRQPIPKQPIPKNVTIEETPFEEKQLIAREIDLIKRKENPDFKGAFHEKKRKTNRFKRNTGKLKRKKRT